MDELDRGYGWRQRDLAGGVGIIVGISGRVDHTVHTDGRRIDDREHDGDPRVHPGAPIAVGLARVPHQPRVRRSHHDSVLHAVHLHDDDAQRLDILGADVSSGTVHADGVRHGQRVHEHGHRHRPLLGRHVPVAVAHHQVALEDDDRHHLDHLARTVLGTAGRRADGARARGDARRVDGRLCGGVAGAS